MSINFAETREESQNIPNLVDLVNQQEAAIKFTT